MFQRYDANVLCGCCKSRSRCCICCHGYIRMLQTFIPNVSSIFFLDICYKCVYLEFAYVSQLCCSVLSECCIYFTMAFKCFLYVFASVSDACFKYFIYLQTYVASVASACFKSRPDVVSPSSLSATLPQCLLLLVPIEHPLPPLPLLDASDIQGGAGPTWTCKTAWENNCRRGRPDASVKCFQEPARYDY
jgi:hypothetical protein